jgi:MFS family permease
MVVAGYAWFILNLIFPSIRNKNNMDLDDNHAATYLSLVTSAFFYGSIVGACLSKFSDSFDPQKVWLFTMIVIIIVNPLFLLENKILMTISRFIFGIVSPINSIVCYVLIGQTALPHHRVRFLSFPLATYAVSTMGYYSLQLFDNGGKTFWRYMVAFPSILGCILVLFHLIFIKNINCLPFLISSKGYEQTVEIANTIYDPESAESLLDEFNKIVIIEDKDEKNDNKVIFAEFKLYKR